MLPRRERPVIGKIRWSSSCHCGLHCDADFAAESANLTRAQILVQSGTSVLQIANTQPQNVLALLRG